MDPQVAFEPVSHEPHQPPHFPEFADERHDAPILVSVGHRPFSSNGTHSSSMKANASIPQRLIRIVCWSEPPILGLGSITPFARGLRRGLVRPVGGSEIEGNEASGIGFPAL
jgi:hypothetical protein